MKLLRAESAKRRRLQQGFTLLEAVMVLGIGALTASAFFSLQYAVLRQSRFVTEGILTRRDAQEAVRTISRDLSGITELTYDAQADPNRIGIKQDFNVPRTADTTQDDLVGEIVYSPAAGTISIIDDIDSPDPRILASGVQSANFGVQGNMVTFELNVRPTPQSDVSTLRMTFALRNIPH